MQKVNKLSLKKQIFVRDNYTCQYCDSPVYVAGKRHSKRLNHDSATIDHVLPKSKGGKLTMKNSVTSCYRCNMVLGDSFDNFTAKRNFIQNFLQGMSLVVEPVQPDIVEEDVLDEKIRKWEREQDKRDRVRIYRGKNHARLRT